MNHTMLVWRAPGVFENITMHSGETAEEFRKQDDGWFKVENKAWFALRDGEKEAVFDAMDRDMELHVNELIMVE